MEDNYKIAFSEVYDILKFTDTSITDKIPTKFKEFINLSRDKSYRSNIIPYIPLENQVLLDETKCIIALIYRKYLATEEEKIKFSENDKRELIEEEKNKLEKYNPDKIFEKIEEKVVDNTESILTQNILPTVRENRFITKIKQVKQLILNLFNKNKSK